MAPREIGADPSSNASPRFAPDEVPRDLFRAQRFPDPEVLRNGPLNAHFRDQLVSDPKPAQFAAIGRLVIRTDGPEPMARGFGTAWAAGPSWLVTSAHNVYDSNRQVWSRSLEFLPGFDHYRQTDSPSFRVTGCTVPKSYLGNPKTNLDLAFCYVDGNVGDRVGATIALRPIRGIEVFDHTSVSIVGYPAGSSFDFGNQLWQSKGDFLFGQSNGVGENHSPVLASSFGGGASGSPWLVEHDGEYVAVGVTSGHGRLRYSPDEPNLMSLVSPLVTADLIEQLQQDAVYHEFKA